MGRDSAFPCIVYRTRVSSRAHRRFDTFAFRYPERQSGQDRHLTAGERYGYRLRIWFRVLLCARQDAKAFRRRRDTMSTRHQRLPSPLRSGASRPRLMRFLFRYTGPLHIHWRFWVQYHCVFVPVFIIDSANRFFSRHFRKFSAYSTSSTHEPSGPDTAQQG
jgi:hypothetical protein